MIWVLSGDAPVADVNEFAVLGTMADQASPDGCGTWLSKETIAARTHVSEETVKRCWRNMLKRGLIAKGDQALVRHYRADRRPVVFDLLIPYDWFSNVDRINTERGRRGLPPLTPEDRPPIAPAPAKKGRADKGKPRTKKATDQQDTERGNSQTPREEPPAEPHGGTTSRRRGNYKSSTGELTVPQPSKNTPSQDPGKNRTTPPSVRPSVQVENACARGTEGRTGKGSLETEEEQPGAARSAEGTRTGAAPESSSSEGAVPGAGAVLGAGGRETTPGMEVLVRVGQLNPELAIGGPVLEEQARKLDARIADSEAAGEAWEPAHLVTLLSAPLGAEIRVSGAAVVAGRIRKLPRTPKSFMQVQTAAIPSQGTPLPSSVPDAADRSFEESVRRRVRLECPGCGADSPDGTLCGTCAGWPQCDGGCGRRLEAGGTCTICRLAGHRQQVEHTPTEDGVCSGYDGPCGRPVQTLGLCGKCRIKAEQDRAARDTDWAAQVAAVAALSDAERDAAVAALGEQSATAPL